MGLSKKQIQEYQTGYWKEKRLRILQRDNYRCAHCGNQKKEKDLQVHHLEYVDGNRVWECPDDYLITLCKRCHAEKHDKIRPSSGWEYLGSDDLGDLIGECEYCHADIRYEHYLYHPIWGELTVGAVCADKLTMTDVASKIEEERKRYASRLKRFIKSRRWKELYNSDSYMSQTIFERNYMISVGKKNDGYSISVSFLCSSTKKRRQWKPLHSGKKRFLTIDEAKAHVFKIIEDGTLEKYIERHYPNEMARE